MSTQLSPTCLKIAKLIEGLEGEVQALSDELHEASPAQKPGIVQQIKALNIEITDKKAALQQCIKEHPYVPPEEPEPRPKECVAIAEEIERLKLALAKEIRDAVAPLQEDLHDASPAQKPLIIQQIRHITADIKENSQTAKEIVEKTKAYDACIAVHDGLPVLNATFAGRATLWTSNENAPGPFYQTVNIGLRFGEWDHGPITVTNFPTISITYDTNSPVGTVTTTVALHGSSGGTFNPITNRISLGLHLFFHHSTALAGDSTLNISLQAVSPLSNAGAITLSGNAPFQGGYLGDDVCSMTVEGTISPRP